MSTDSGETRRWWQRVMNWLGVVCCHHDFLLHRDGRTLCVQCTKCHYRSPGVVTHDRVRPWSSIRVGLERHRGSLVKKG